MKIPCALLLTVLLANPVALLAQQTPAADPAPAATVAPHPVPLQSFPRLVLFDFKAVLGAPLSWKAPQWERFSLGVAAVGAAALLDRTVRDAERRDHSSFSNQVAQDFEPLGNAAAFGVLSTFYLTGLLTDDARARSVAEDGLIASLIAGGIVTPAIKLAAGRARPRATDKTFDFKPFSGSSSFPSGHTTEAFAVASVIAAEYDSKWVKGISYGTAVLVGFARVHHQAHFLSDVTAGALIGSGIGRSVVHRNAESRHRLSLVPLLGPKSQPGVAVAVSFR